MKQLKENRTCNAWLVVKTKPRAEKKLAQQLNAAGYEAFAPTYTTLRQWSDRKKRVELPLISGVIFIKNDNNNIQALYQFSNATGILKEYNRPALVTQCEINNLKILANGNNLDGIESQPMSHFDVGVTVQVKRGEFAGIVGELIAVNGKHRLVVQLRILQVELVINIAKANVEVVETRQVA